MWHKNGPPEPVTIIGPLLLLAGCVFLLHLLPGQMLIFLIVWTFASFPIGVLIGHCVLSEQQTHR